MLAIMACILPARAAELTVADDDGWLPNAPISGGWYGYSQHNQLIYPAESLVAMRGKKVTSMTFYVREYSNSSPGGKVTFSLANIDAGTTFTSDGTTPVTADLVQVYSSEPNIQSEWTIAFDENANFIYQGGDLLIDVTTEPGNAHTLWFYSKGQDKNNVIFSYDNRPYIFYDALPKATFTYDLASMEVSSNKKIDCSSTVVEGKAVDIGKLIVKSIGNLPVKPVVTFAGDHADMFAVDPAEPVEIAAGDSVEYSIIFNASRCTEAGVIPAGVAITDAYGKADPIEDVTVRGAALTGEQNMVCDKRDRDWRVPLNTNETTTNYPESQFIYPAEKLTALNGRRITGIKFFAQNNIQVRGGKFQLSIKETDRTIFTDAGVDKITDMTVAATASIAEGTDVIEFVFTEPIAYHGGNLAVEVLTVERTKVLNVYDFWWGEYQDNTTAYSKYNDVDSYAKSLHYFLPKAEFSLIQGEPVYSMEVTSDKTVNCRSVIGNNAVLEAGKLVLTNTGNQPVKPVVTLSGNDASMFTIEPVSLTELTAGSSVEYTITFTAPEGTPAGDYTAGITITDEYNYAPAINDVTINAVAVAPNVDIVCDFLRYETGWVNAGVPIFTGNSDQYLSKSQFIYPAEKLTAFVGRKISSIKFFAADYLNFNGGKFQLSIKETDQTEFGPREIVFIDDMTVAATAAGNSATKELDFVFTEPIVYNGGNLAVEVAGIEKTNLLHDNTAFWYGEQQTTETAIAFLNDRYGGYWDIYEFLPRAQFTTLPADPITLADMITSGKKEAVYTIADDLHVVYNVDNIVWARDMDADRCVNPTEPPTDQQVDYMRDILGLQREQWQQYNWVMLDFGNASDQKPAVGDIIIGNTLTGQLSDTDNIAMTVNANVQIKTTSGAPEYVPNVYCAANFHSPNTQTSPINGATYWFMRPRVMEVVTITGAVWNGDGFYMPANEVVDSRHINAAGLIGAFGIDTTFSPTASLKQGEAYEFMAVVKKKATHNENEQPTPRRLNVNDGASAADCEWEVYPLTLSSPKIVTGISRTSDNREIVDVTYTDVAGRVSKRPFNGVNIVVTRYTDGSTTNVKKIFK